MNVKEAVRIAREHIASLYEDEGAINIGLEETKYSEEKGLWSITMGFSRPWDKVKVTAPLTIQDMFTPRAVPELRRTFKVVQIRDEDGKVESVVEYPLK